MKSIEPHLLDFEKEFKQRPKSVSNVAQLYFKSKKITKREKQTHEIRKIVPVFHKQTNRLHLVACLESGNVLYEELKKSKEGLLAILRHLMERMQFEEEPMRVDGKVPTSLSGVDFNNTLNG